MEEIVPIRQVMFECSLHKQAISRQTGVEPKLPLFSKKETSHRLLTTDQYPSPTFSAKSSHVVKHMNKHDLQYNLYQGFREKKVMRNTANNACRGSGGDCKCWEADRPDTVGRFNGV